MTATGNKSWSGSAVPQADEVVIGDLLEKHAAARGSEVFAWFEDGSQLTYAEMLNVSRRAARGLQALGVGQDDAVLSWLPNGLDALRVWFGANMLGAVYIPINTAYRGRLLEHVIDNAGARVAVVHADLLPRLADIDTGTLERIVVVGGQSSGLGGVEVLSREALEASPEPISPSRRVEPWDVQSVIYTSGTTGPSKGVVCSHLHMATSAGVAFEGRFRPSDRYMINLPLFHAGGTLGVHGALLMGGSIAVVGSFRTSEFWDIVRSSGTTCMTLLGVMANFLTKEPPTGQDRRNPLQTVFMVPLTEDATTFATRFGVTVVTMFNMTEVSIPLVSEDNPKTPGTCGRVRAGVEARLVDEFDREVPMGAVGELILRASRPWSMNSGYWRNPEATAAAWRNGWFHTGDGFRSEDGEFFFVDRMKDAIRRRGENVSSFEVEAELLAHPAVREAAAVAVPSDLGEDEILAVVAPSPDHMVEPTQLLEFLKPRMAHFMLPRYVRVLADLPKTPTSKIQKHLLRSQGVTEDTWDREAVGMRVRGERIGGKNR